MSSRTKDGHLLTHSLRLDSFYFFGGGGDGDGEGDEMKFVAIMNPPSRK